MCERVSKIERTDEGVFCADCGEELGFDGSDQAVDENGTVDMENYDVSSVNTGF